MDLTGIPLNGKTRLENDLIGDMDIPEEYYYGVQTARARDNFQISRSKLYFYPQLISALAQVKQAAALANQDLGILDGHIANAIVDACEEIREGKFHEHFVVDMMQGGAGTSTNMNANEVIANRALEHLGYAKGEYDHCHPNNHVNLSQSTNDAYPSALRIGTVGTVD
jgi:aspartate ammonia-lyase